MEKTYEAIMQAAKSGCRVSFTTDAEESRITVLEVWNSKTNKGRVERYTIEISDIELRDNAISDLINKARCATY